MSSIPAGGAGRAIGAMDDSTLRLAFWLETTGLEAKHLQITDSRLFALPFDAERAASLSANVDLSEQLDAFAARFGRLQDALGDKLLPALLNRIGEPIASVIDKLERSARLGLLPCEPDTWLAARALRNRMADEYIRKPEVLAEAVNRAHQLVPMLQEFAAR